ncbi:MAG: hypothetical protein EOM76_07935 [Sphingobacteriia bacterium]|nr:hypothetical protein [Sphingobacteriia bacterium]
MDEEKRQHLTFIQGVITRMNTNSFQIKGWTITIVSALLALYANSSNVIYIFVAIIPVLLFWFLDAYYLQQERKFRGIYNDVAELGDETKKNKVRPFEMPLQNYKEGKYCYFNVFRSKTIAWFYGALFFLLLVGGLILKYKDCITINCK